MIFITSVFSLNTLLQHSLKNQLLTHLTCNLNYPKFFKNAFYTNILSNILHQYFPPILPPFYFFLNQTFKKELNNIEFKSSMYQLLLSSLESRPHQQHNV